MESWDAINTQVVRSAEDFVSVMNSLQSKSDVHINDY